jgi:hypothetical protein
MLLHRGSMDARDSSVKFALIVARADSFHASFHLVEDGQKALATASSRRVHLLLDGLQGKRPVPWEKHEHCIAIVTALCAIGDGSSVVRVRWRHACVARARTPRDPFFTSASIWRQLDSGAPCRALDGVNPTRRRSGTR